MSSVDLNKFRSYLDNSEIVQVQKLKFDWLRDKAVFTKGLLRILIADYLNKNPIDINFTFNEFGKPYIVGDTDKLHFNISHSDDLAVFAFTGSSEIGVDVERIKTIDDMDGVVNLTFTEYEKSWFKRIADTEIVETFYKIWTIKEAFIKAIGRGFSFDPKDIELTNESGDQIVIRNIFSGDHIHKEYNVRTLNTVSGYIISLVYENVKDINIYKWTTDKG